MPGQCSVTVRQHLNTVLTFPGVRGHGGVAGVGAAALDHGLGADPAEPGLGAPPPPPPHPAPAPSWSAAARAAAASWWRAGSCGDPGHELSMNNEVDISVPCSDLSLHQRQAALPHKICHQIVSFYRAQPSVKIHYLEVLKIAFTQTETDITSPYQESSQTMSFSSL